MGMYTELILGCGLKEETPQEIIDTLKYMCELDVPSDRQWPNSNHPKGERCSWMFHSSSYYFAVNPGHCRMWFDKICDGWKLDVRSNLKNYTSEIENFLEWLHPWIDQGSGDRDFYAIVTYEEQEEPTIFYLKDKQGELATYPCNK